MKNLLLGFALAAVLSLGFVSTTRAQEATNCLSIDPIALLVVHSIQGQYEFALDEASSLAIRAEFVPSSDYTNKYSAVGFGAAWKFYVTSDHAVKGLNVGPAVDAFFFNRSELNKSSTIIAIGGDAAYKFLLGHFSVEPQLSLRIGLLGDEVPNYKTTYIFPSVYLGYAW